MTTGSRGKRRQRARGERAPAVYRGAQPVGVSETPTVQHGTRDGFLNWRMFSGMIVLSLSVVIFLFFSADAFYVRSIGVSGLRYLQREEIFRWADIADLHLFWIDPAQVRQQIMRSPAVADVEVILGWPPNSVLINVLEREPALIWSQGGVDVWVDIHGYVLMQPPEQRPDLVRVVLEGPGADELINPNQRLASEVISGALQLGEQVADRTLRYHPTNGLGFTGPGGWEAWFGTGADMPTKLLVYQRIIAAWEAEGRQPRYIIVSNPDSPVDCCTP